MAKTHGLTSGEHKGKYARAYRIWANMVQRCFNEEHPRYPDYGGRGIKCVVRWRQFENFIDDMGVPPAGTTLDRKNNNGPYSKANCRWTDAFTQAANSRRAVQVKLRGKTQCISEWCREMGVSYGLYKARMKRGWSQEDALTKAPANRGLRALRGKVLHINSEV